MSSASSITEHNGRHLVRFESLPGAELLGFIEGCNLGLLCLDADARIEHANPVLLRMFGYSFEEFVGHSFDNFHVDLSVDRDTREKIAQNDSFENCPLQLRHKDGLILDVELNSIHANNNSVDANRWYVVRDVSAAKLSDRLREEQTRLAGLRADIGFTLARSANLPDALRQCAEILLHYVDASCVRVWTCSDDGCALELQASSGITVSSTDPHREISVGKSKIGMIAALRQPLISDEFFEDVLFMDRSWSDHGGSVSFAGFPLIVGEDVLGVIALFSLQPLASGFLGSLEEISDLIAVAIQKKNSESTRNRAKLLAEEANRTKSEFLANMSHEIRTPLTAILGYTELLTDRTISDTDHAAHIETIRRSGDYLMTILNDILDLSKIEAGKMTAERVLFSPADLVNDIIDCFQETARTKQLMLTAEVVGKIPQSIYSDPIRIRQVLINLVGNAFKFTERGFVRITVRFIPQDEANDPQLAFEVSDTGIGMTEEQIASLFVPFVQADNSTTRKFGGTGLGLTISRRIARMLNGDVVVKSVLGAGSTFTATIAARSNPDVEFIDKLPLRTMTTPSLQAEIQLDARILLAEDNLVNQRLIRNWLTKAGANVDTADNGQIALEKVTNQYNDRSKDAGINAVYDLILMDMHMPILDGCSVIGQLRELGFHLPIVALTANAMNEDRHKCFDAGCNEFLTKPLSRDRLLKVCFELINKIRTTDSFLKARERKAVTV